MFEATGQKGTVMTLRKRLAQPAYRRDVEIEFVLAELRHQRRLHGTEAGDKQRFSSDGLAHRGRFSSRRHSLGHT
jgi:hypothetical protein